MFYDDDKELKKFITLNNHQYVMKNALISCSDNDVITLLALTPVHVITVTTISLSIHLHNASTALNHPCCLHCSKIIVIKLRNICDMKKNTCCVHCHKKHKLCKSVCETSVKHHICFNF